MDKGAAQSPQGFAGYVERYREESATNWVFLDDVRSLSLPGSYNQKITHLGRSLLSFSRLKHIDLSRNAIESLEVR